MSLDSLCPLEGEGEGTGHSDRHAPPAATDPNANLMARMLDGLSALSSEVQQSNESGEHRMNSLVRQINDNVEDRLNTLSNGIDQRLGDLATSSEQEWNSMNRQFEELAHRQFDMDEVLSTLVGRPTVLSTGPISRLRDAEVRVEAAHS